jgi:hypothetical protein
VKHIVDNVEIRAKMYRIAQKLAARVQGDGGEYYGADGKRIP